MDKSKVAFLIPLIKTGAFNDIFDKGEDIVNKGLTSISRVGEGIQGSLNALAKGFIDGINNAHQAKMDTIHEAFVGECNRGIFYSALEVTK